LEACIFNDPKVTLLYSESRKYGFADWASAPKLDTHERIMRPWMQLHAHPWLNFFSFSFPI